MSQDKITKTIQIDLAGYRYEANNQVYEIESGSLRTDTYDNGNIAWNWQINLDLRKADFIPFQKPTALLYSDGSEFVRTRAIKREKSGNLTLIQLVPYIAE